MAARHLTICAAFALSACSYDHGYGPDASLDNVTVSFGAPATTADEASGTVTIPVVLSGVASQTVTVDYVVGSSTAQRPEDYELADGKLVFAPGETQKSIDVKIAMDSLEEADETIVVELSKPVGATLGANPTYTVTISADILPRVSFMDPASSSAAESMSPQVEVRLTTGPKDTVTVELGVAGTASSADRGVTDGQLITFQANETSKLVPLGVVQDLLDEDDETIDLSLRNPSPKLLLPPTGTMHAHTITDDDPLPTVGFAAATSMTNESQMIDLTVTLSAVSGRVVTVGYAVTGGTAGGGDATVTGAPGTVTFMPGQMTRTISIVVTNDPIDEPNETLTVALSNPTNATLATTANTLTIMDDDSPPSIGFAQTMTSVGETMTTVSLSVSLATASAFDVSVPYHVALVSTADNPEDYTLGSATLTLMIPAGMTTASIPINVKADTLDEANETVIVELGAPTNATLGAGVATLTITDDDPSPTVSFTSAGSSPNEGNNSITLTVQLSDISGQDVIVPYTIDAASTATDPADYTISPASPVTIPAGSTSTTITIAMKEDTLSESDETVGVVLGTPTNATLATPSMYTLTIRDDDQQADVSWNPAESDSGDPEGTHPPGTQTRQVTFTMVLTAASGLTVSVPITYSGTATLGTDYSGPTMVTFAPGQTSADVTLDIDKDVDVEPDETVTMTINAAGVTNAGTTSPLVRTYTLQNDD